MRLITFFCSLWTMFSNGCASVLHAAAWALFLAFRLYALLALARMAMAGAKRVAAAVRKANFARVEARCNPPMVDPRWAKPMEPPRTDWDY